MLWRLCKVKNLSPKKDQKVKNNFVAFCILQMYKIILKHKVDINLQVILRLANIFLNLIILYYEHKTDF